MTLDELKRLCMAVTEAHRAYVTGDHINIGVKYHALKEARHNFQTACMEYVKERMDDDE